MKTEDIRPSDGHVRYLSSLGAIALSFGYAVGWGSFVLPGTVFLPNAGPAGTIIGLLIGTVAIIVLAFNYHKMTVSIHDSGGAYSPMTLTDRKPLTSLFPGEHLSRLRT